MSTTFKTFSKKKKTTFKKERKHNEPFDLTDLYTNNNVKLLQLVWKFREGGEQRGVERMRVVGRRVEGNGSPPPYLDVFKIIKGEGSNYPSPCLNVLKIRMERRGND